MRNAQKRHKIYYWLPGAVSENGDCKWAQRILFGDEKCSKTGLWGSMQHNECECGSDIPYPSCS